MPRDIHSYPSHYWQIPDYLREHSALSATYPQPRATHLVHEWNSFKAALRLACRDPHISIHERKQLSLLYKKVAPIVARSSKPPRPGGYPEGTMASLTYTNSSQDPIAMILQALGTKNLRPDIPVHVPEEKNAKNAKETAPPSKNATPPPMPVVAYPKRSLEEIYPETPPSRIKIKDLPKRHLPPLLSLLAAEPAEPPT